MTVFLIFRKVDAAFGIVHSVWSTRELAQQELRYYPAHDAFEIQEWMVIDGVMSELDTW